MQCEGDDEPDSYVVPGEQHPGYSTVGLIFLVRGAPLTRLQQNLDFLSYLQERLTEESTMTELGIYSTVSRPFAAGQDLVARTGAALPYAPSREVCPPTYLSC